MKPIVIKFPESLIEEIKKVQVETHKTSFSDCVRSLIVSAIEKRNPAYIRVLKERPAKMSDKEKIEYKVNMGAKLAEARKGKEIDRQQNICDALGGEVEIINGIKHCRYSQYVEGPGKKVDDVSILDPFSMLSDETVATQYKDLFNRTGEEVTKRVKELYETSRHPESN
jgi:hypothetical protein